MKLPTWDNAKDNVFNGSTTPLDKFIYEYEPSELRSAGIWRKELADLVSYVKDESTERDSRSAPDEGFLPADNQLEIKFTD